MRRLSRYGRSLVAVTAMAGSACSSDPATPTTPTTPTAVTLTFSGTVSVNGAVTFPYFPNQGGSTNLTLKAVEPDAAVTVDAGTGEFTPGETVFQGADIDTATWSATVFAWNKAAKALTVRGMSGAFTADGTLQGRDSKAEWTGKTIATTVVGIALGTWSGTVCTIVLTNDTAGAGGLINGVVQSQGSLCARIYDVGKLTGSANFTIEITHF